MVAYGLTGRLTQLPSYAISATIGLRLIFKTRASDIRLVRLLTWSPSNCCRVYSTQHSSPHIYTLPAQPSSFRQRRPDPDQSSLLMCSPT